MTRNRPINITTQYRLRTAPLQTLLTLWKASKNVSAYIERYSMNINEVIDNKSNLWRHKQVILSISFVNKQIVTKVKSSTFHLMYALLKCVSKSQLIGVEPGVIEVEHGYVYVLFKDIR